MFNNDDQVKKSSSLLKYLCRLEKNKSRKIQFLQEAAIIADLISAISRDNFFVVCGCSISSQAISGSDIRMRKSDDRNAFCRAASYPARTVYAVGPSDLSARQHATPSQFLRYEQCIRSRNGRSRPSNLIYLMCRPLTARMQFLTEAF